MAALNCYMLKLLHAKSMRVRLYTSLPSHQAVCVYIRMYNLHIVIAYKFDPALHVALVAMMKTFMHMDTIVF